MYTKFNNLNQEKKEIILSSAINEFAQNGYHKASTDIIAKNSNIAKGSLFHYFKNKKNLYLYIVKLSMDLINDKVIEKANNIQSRDFFERVKEIAIYKQQVFKEYPLYIKITMDAFSNSNEEINQELSELIFRYQSQSIKFMETYIISYMSDECFRQGVSKEDALFITNTVFEALSNKYINIIKSGINKEDEIEQSFEGFDRYINILKYGLYKK